jgi:hypothetical protein
MFYGADAPNRRGRNLRSGRLLADAPVNPHGVNKILIVRVGMVGPMLLARWVSSRLVPATSGVCGHALLCAGFQTRQLEACVWLLAAVQAGPSGVVWPTMTTSDLNTYVLTGPRSVSAGFFDSSDGFRFDPTGSVIVDTTISNSVTVASCDSGVWRDAALVCVVGGGLAPSAWDRDVAVIQT